MSMQIAGDPGGQWTTCFVRREEAAGALSYEGLRQALCDARGRGRRFVMRGETPEVVGQLEKAFMSGRYLHHLPARRTYSAALRHHAD